MPASELEILGSTGAILQGPNSVHFYAGLAPHAEIWFSTDHFSVVGPEPVAVEQVEMISEGPPEWTATLRLSGPVTAQHYLVAEFPGHHPATVPFASKP